MEDILSTEDMNLIKETVKRNVEPIEKYVRTLNSNDKILSYLQNLKTESKKQYANAEANKQKKTGIYWKLFLGKIENDIQYYEKCQVEENSLLKIVPQSAPLPANFKQIEISLDTNVILNYFLILAKERNPYNDLPYMSEQEVLRFVKKNFKVFGFVPSGEYCPINLNRRQKNFLRSVIYLFYNKYDKNSPGSKTKYGQLLIWNFELFREENLETLLSNMSDSKKPADKYWIDFEKHIDFF